MKDSKTRRKEDLEPRSKTAKVPLGTFRVDDRFSNLQLGIDDALEDLVNLEQEETANG